jgi:pimeloyl-ACP methyl ester carboxylesterase
VAYTLARPKMKRTAVLLHGLPASKELFLPLNAYLHRSLRLAAMDMNDYGESDKLSGPLTHEQRADILEEFRVHLKLKKFILIAHDLGASVAVDYVRKYGKYVEKLVLISAPVYPDFKPPLIVRITRLSGVGEFLTTFFLPVLFRVSLLRGMVHKWRLNPGLIEAMLSAFRGIRGRKALLRNLRWGDPAEVFARYVQTLRSIKIPVLILHGSRDPYVPVEHAHRLKKDIPRSGLVILTEASHFLPVDVPADVAMAINDFVE